MNGWMPQSHEATRCMKLLGRGAPLAGHASGVLMFQQNLKGDAAASDRPQCPNLMLVFGSRCSSNQDRLATARTAWFKVLAPG